MTAGSLTEWLQKLEALHPREIDLGLERISTVAAQLDILSPHCPVVTIAGTNGKGSTICVLDGLLRSQGKRTGRYTSPHLLSYNERICVAGEAVADAAIVSAFEQIEAARGTVSLTYFEFGLLAALLVFRDPTLDFILLEVGLGGRLDAVNIIDPSVAVITSIALDHQEWLGDSREAIGVEKAGILRAGVPLVCADLDPPAAVVAAAEELGCPSYFITADDSGQFSGGHSLRAENVAAAWQVARLLDVSIEPAEVAAIAAAAAPPGRLQRAQSDGVEILLDVAHNPEAVANLKDYLAANPVSGRQIAVFAALSDKDIHGMIQPCLEAFDAWFLAALPGVGRGRDPEALASELREHGLTMVSTSKNPRQALRRALSLLQTGDRVVVFGSFYTVAAVLPVVSRDRSVS